MHLWKYPNFGSIIIHEYLLPCLSSFFRTEYKNLFDKFLRKHSSLYLLSDCFQCKIVFLEGFHLLIRATKFKRNEFWIPATNFCSHVWISTFYQNNLTKHKGSAVTAVAGRKQNNQSMESLKTSLKNLKRTLGNSLNSDENVLFCSICCFIK